MPSSRNLKVKYFQCSVCDGTFVVTTKKADLCPNCRLVKRKTYEENYRFKKFGSKPTHAIRSKDTLPPIDWVMERQFPRFFELLGKRYKDLKDVTLVSQTVKTSIRSKEHRDATASSKERSLKTSTLL